MASWKFAADGTCNQWVIVLYLILKTCVGTTEVSAGRLHMYNFTIASGVGAGNKLLKIE